MTSLGITVWYKICVPVRKNRTDDVLVISLVGAEYLFLFYFCFVILFPSAVLRKHNVIVLSDEIYARLHFEDDHKSLAKVSYKWQNSV